MTKTVTVVTYITIDVPDDVEPGQVASALRTGMYMDATSEARGSATEGTMGWELMSVEPESWYEEPDMEVALDDISAESIKSFLVEAIHGGWDAVPPSDVAAHNRLLYDLGLWAKHTP